MKESRKFKPYYRDFHRSDFIGLIEDIFSHQDRFDEHNDNFRDFGPNIIEICMNCGRKKMAKELSQKLVYSWSSFCDFGYFKINDIFDRLLPTIYRLTDIGFKKEANQLISKAVDLYTKAIKEDMAVCTQENLYWKEIYNLSKKEGEIHKAFLEASKESLEKDLTTVEEENPYRDTVLKSIGRIEAALATL